MFLQSKCVCKIPGGAVGTVVYAVFRRGIEVSYIQKAL